MQRNSKYINRLMYCDCVKGMAELPDDGIPTTITSPPYDKIRDYGGHKFDFDAIARQLFRITAPGGVLVWIVQDQCVKGNQSGTSFRQCLRFKELGFNLHNTIILAKTGCRTSSKNRYGTAPEYAFVFSKGKPRYVNLIKDHRNRTAGEVRGFVSRRKDGRLKAPVKKVIPPWRGRTHVWNYTVGFNHTTADRFAFEHPALMSEDVAEDLIISYSRFGDLVFDPMMGASTTCKMALLRDRQYLGMEIYRKYYDIAVERMALAHVEHQRQLDEFFGLCQRPVTKKPCFTMERIDLPTRKGQ